MNLWLTPQGCTVPGSKLGRSKIFIRFPDLPDLLWGPLSPYSMGTGLPSGEGGGGCKAVMVMTYPTPRGAVHLLLQYACLAWTGTTLRFYVQLVNFGLAVSWKTSVVQPYEIRTRGSLELHRGRCS
jgi:hypothetical protein